MPDRLVRSCAKCNVQDDHSHHVQYMVFTHPGTGMPVDISISKHIQCCAEDGCEVCATDVEFAQASLGQTPIGALFTGYMQNKTQPHLAAMAERHGIATAEA